jgi:hypothetical protein
MITADAILARTTLLVQDHLVLNPADVDVPGAFANTTVGLVVDSAQLEHCGFVVAMETLRVLLAGMCVGLRVEIRGRDRPARLGPPFAQGHWLDALAEYRSDACGPMSAGKLDSGCSLRIGLGASDGRFDFELAADQKTSWLRGVGAGPAWQKSTIWSGAGAAVLAAAEIYKTVIAGLGIAVRQDSDLHPVRDFHWRLADDGPASTHGRVGVVSAGAITTSALFMLARAGISLQLDVWDGDTLKLPNFNRYPLFDVRHLGMLKVDALANLDIPILKVNPIPRGFDSHETAEARTFLVGADRIAPRWDVARCQPEIAIVGSTEHYLTLDSIHRDEQDGCPACLHPRDDEVDGDVPTVSFVSFAAGLEVALLLARPPRIGSWYSLTRTWLRPDVELSRRIGPVPDSPDCPLGFGQ